MLRKKPPVRRATSLDVRNRRLAMGRFDKIEALRFFTDVHVPGYDVGKSLAKSRKQKQKTRRDQQQGAPPTVEPGPVTFGSSESTSNPEKADACPAFKIDL
jgi:hypothetical protein